MADEMGVEHMGGLAPIRGVRPKADTSKAPRESLTG